MYYILGMKGNMSDVIEVLIHGFFFFWSKSFVHCYACWYKLRSWIGL